jgi:hypothetical protein
MSGLGRLSERPPTPEIRPPDVHEQIGLRPQASKEEMQSTALGVPIRRRPRAAASLGADFLRDLDLGSSSDSP